MAKKTVEVNRKLYERVRKMDHNTLRLFVNEIYSKGYAEGTKAAEGLKPEEVKEVLLSLKGIGEKKADAIIEALNNAHTSRKGQVDR